MEYRQKNSGDAVVGVILFVIGGVILLPIALFGIDGWGIVFRILMSH